LCPRPCSLFSMRRVRRLLSPPAGFIPLCVIRFPVEPHFQRIDDRMRPLPMHPDNGKLCPSHSPFPYQRPLGALVPVSVITLCCNLSRSAAVSALRFTKNSRLVSLVDFLVPPEPGSLDSAPGLRGEDRYLSCSTSR
jgi:hypothetical protein